MLFIEDSQTSEDCIIFLLVHSFDLYSHPMRLVSHKPQCHGHEKWRRQSDRQLGLPGCLVQRDYMICTAQVANGKGRKKKGRRIRSA